MQYPGLKEEYYLHDTELDRGYSRVGLGVDRRGTADSAAPTARARALPPRPHVTRCSGRSCCWGAATRSRPSLFRAPTSSERPSLACPAVASFPSSAIDAHSLIADADLVVSAGGTMNREAVALGVPVYTVSPAGWAVSTSS